MIRSIQSTPITALVPLTALAGLVLFEPTPAKACGCISPPIPPAAVDGEFAVNQKAEQIIFEVDDATVSAHVLIRFEGDPESFAWIVPVPNIVDVELSDDGVFSLVETASRSRPSVQQNNHCPAPGYLCQRHPPAHCPSDTASTTGWVTSGSTGAGTGGTGSTGGESGGGTDGIDVSLQKQVGSYDVVAFSADEAELAVDWLRENQFIVNDSMTPYMQPYVDRGMQFVAAKLVPGAGVDQIRPLKLVYEGEHPMIPLKLTAVAAEPHMPIIAYIYGETSYGPMAAPVIELDPAKLGQGQSYSGSNYSALLARSIDEAGGAAFVVDYWGSPPEPDLNQNDLCCQQIGWCAVQNNGQCECPLGELDRDDCEAVDGLYESIELYDQLRRHQSFTRLTTLMSPEEMVFDPMFMPRVYDTPRGHASLPGRVESLRGCESDVLEPAQLAQVQARAPCSDLYCGEGVCAWTADSEYGCSCAPGYTSRTYTTLTGQISVTCVPEVGTVDLGIGLTLPDACAATDCGAGTCLPVGGFPTCQCPIGQVAVLQVDPEGERSPGVTCKPSVGTSSDPGGRDYTTPLAELAVCIPAPPSCGPTGWLRQYTTRPPGGVWCEHSFADPADLVPPPPPTCEDQDTGTGGSTTTGSAGSSGSVEASGGGAGSDATTTDRGESEEGAAAEGSGCQLARQPGSGVLTASISALLGF